MAFCYKNDRQEHLWVFSKVWDGNAVFQIVFEGAEGRLKLWHTFFMVRIIKHLGIEVLWSCLQVTLVDRQKFFVEVYSFRLLMAAKKYTLS